MSDNLTHKLLQIDIKLDEIKFQQKAAKIHAQMIADGKVKQNVQ